MKATFKDKGICSIQINDEELEYWLILSKVFIVQMEETGKCAVDVI